MNNDKRLLIGSTVGLLLGAGGLAAVTLSQGGGNAPSSSRLMLGQLGAGGQAAAPAAPGAPGAPGVKPTPTAKGGGGSKGPGNSFSDAPPSYPGGGGTGGGGGAAPGGGFGPPGGGFGPPGGGYGGAPIPAAGGYGGAPGLSGAFPSATGVGGGAITPSNANTKPAPVKNGVQATNPRKDPFVSYRFFGPQKPPAYSLLAPLRLASLPKPPPLPRNPDPNIAFGPLPYVPRRVAGILYNGSVSAILETGNPGPGADVEVIQPGSKVPSGIAGIPDLTVATITPTQVTLRANDGRTVSVALSGVPAALAGSLQQGQPGGGYPGGGAPGGYPGGAPGGFPGGGIPGGIPGGGSK